MQYTPNMSSQYPVTIQVRVRFSDCDAMGHCNNARYISFIEEARIAYFRALYPEASIENMHNVLPFILGEVSCTFKSPAYCGEVIEIGAGVTRFGSKSMTIAYDLHEVTSGRLVAVGTSELVMFDYKTKTTQPITDEFKARVQKIENKTT